MLKIDDFKQKRQKLNYILYTQYKNGSKSLKYCPF